MDIYSFGIVLSEILKREKPFTEYVEFQKDGKK
jgi:hypothetical protein